MTDIEESFEVPDTNHLLQTCPACGAPAVGKVTPQGGRYECGRTIRRATGRDGWMMTACVPESGFRESLHEIVEDAADAVAEHGNGPLGMNLPPARQVECPRAGCDWAGSDLDLMAHRKWHDAEPTLPAAPRAPVPESPEGDPIPGLDLNTAHAAMERMQSPLDVRDLSDSDVRDLIAERDALRAEVKHLREQVTGALNESIAVGEGIENAGLCHQCRPRLERSISEAMEANDVE